MKMLIKVVLFAVCFIVLAKCQEDKKEVKTTYILKAVELTDEDKQGYIAYHNYLRAEVTPPATNMLELEWDEDLAEVAKNFTRKCKFGHNPSKFRKTATFSYLGENMYFRYPPRPQGVVLKNSLDSFMKEKKRFTYGKYGAKGTGSRYGHYTQMMWANSNKVGCGVTNCGNFKVGRSYWAKAQVVACNYGPGGNVKNKYPYKTGQSCSECPDGKKCLCSEEELSIP